MADAALGTARARRWWMRRPVNPFTINSHAIMEGFLDRAECTRLVLLADTHLAGPSHVVSGNCYTWVKSESLHGRNSGVRELLNVQEIDENLAELVRQRTFPSLFEANIAQPVELIGLSIQLDAIDTRTKRDFHVDCHFPPLLKAFVYLNDVEHPGDGPFTIIPGSHRYMVRRLANDLVNAFSSSARRDMHRFLPHRRARRVLGPAGTLILSTQDAIHKGWGNHWRRNRYALIAYCTPAEYFDGAPLSEGQAFAIPS